MTYCCTHKLKYCSTLIRKVSSCNILQLTYRLPQSKPQSWSTLRTKYRKLFSTKLVIHVKTLPARVKNICGEECKKFIRGTTCFYVSAKIISLYRLTLKTFCREGWYRMSALVFKSQVKKLQTGATVHG